MRSAIEATGFTPIQEVSTPSTGTLVESLKATRAVQRAALADLTGDEFAAMFEQCRDTDRRLEALTVDRSRENMSELNRRDVVRVPQWCPPILAPVIGVAMPSTKTTMRHAVLEMSESASAQASHRLHGTPASAAQEVLSPGAQVASAMCAVTHRALESLAASSLT